MKVITFSIALISPYSWCSRDLRLQCLELHTAFILSQYHWDKEFHFPGKFHLLVKTSTDSVGLGVVYSSIECFHMTSRRPYWCPKTTKRRPCWCPKPVLWEFNSFLMQTLSFVPINLHRCWPREWKHSIVLCAANAVMICEINLQAVAHTTTIHNPQPTIYLFISLSIFFKPILDSRSSILDPRLPLNLEVLLCKIVLFLTSEFITFSKVICEPTRTGKAPYAISILWTCSVARRLRDSQVQSNPNRHIRHTPVAHTRS